MKDEIQAGLQNAIERGYSLEEAIESFISAGYNPVEVKEAANFIKSGTTQIIHEEEAQSKKPSLNPSFAQETQKQSSQPVQPKPIPQPVQPQSMEQNLGPDSFYKKPSADVNNYFKQPQQNHVQKSKSNPMVTVLIVVLIVLIVALILGIVFLKDIVAFFS